MRAQSAPYMSAALGGDSRAGAPEIVYGMSRTSASRPRYSASRASRARYCVSRAGASRLRADEYAAHEFLRAAVADLRGRESENAPASQTGGIIFLHISEETRAARVPAGDERAALLFERDLMLRPREIKSPAARSMESKLMDCGRELWKIRGERDFYRQHIARARAAHSRLQCSPRSITSRASAMSHAGISFRSSRASIRAAASRVIDSRPTRCGMTATSFSGFFAIGDALCFAGGSRLFANGRQLGKGKFARAGVAALFAERDGMGIFSHTATIMLDKIFCKGVYFGRNAT